MKANLDITIPAPCTEQWELMTAVEQGKFCKSCNKVVIDFTTFSESELQAYFKNYTGSVCGRIETKYVSTFSIQPLNQKLKKFLYVFSVVFLFGSMQELKAQDSSVAQDTLQAPPQQSFTVEGKIVDDKKQPLDFVAVYVKRDGIIIAGSKTDLNGNYKLKGIPPGVYTLEAFYIGLGKHIQTLNLRNDHLRCDINFKKNEQLHMLGGLIRIKPQLDVEHPSEQKLDQDFIKHSKY